jgi:large subunit ribosomal protein L4
MPKKMRQGALRSALSERVREGSVFVVEGWTLDKPKTKDFSASLGKLGLDGKTLIVDSLENENLILSARNLRRAKVVNSFGLNIYDLLYHDQLVLSRSAAGELEQLLGARQEEREAQKQPAVSEEAKTEPAKPKRVRKPKKEATEG